LLALGDKSNLPERVTIGGLVISLYPTSLRATEGSAAISWKEEDSNTGSSFIVPSNSLRAKAEAVVFLFCCLQFNMDNFKIVLQFCGYM
jgi:hypothetical protein